MKKRILPVLLAAAITVVSIPMTVFADSSKVVTLGANLTDEQKAAMYQYFGTSKDQVTTIEVTNADERKYMEGIATEAQIGTRTLSCSYVEPTESGGINVKVANLTYVTSSMIASTLTTSGVKNCNVVAACPIAVSGTGALTGIMMAYESATGEELSEEMKEVATEELVTTGNIAETIGNEDAIQLMNEVKEKVISGELEDKDEIRDTVNSVSSQIGITLTDDQINEIVNLMEKISKYDYDTEALKQTLKNITGEDTEGFLANLMSSLKGFFGGENKDGGIINDTDDSVLGSDAVIDSTVDKVKDAVKNVDTDKVKDAVDSVDKEKASGILDDIIEFFQGLFSSAE